MEFLTEGIRMITWQQVVMYGVGILLIWLAIKKEYEPALLLPMGFGAILVNLPLSGVLDQVLAGVGETSGIIEWLFHIGIEVSEAMPVLLFIGIGAMIDFGPLLSNPKMFLFGAGAQFGIFAAILLAVLLGFDLKDAASIGIIGAADGPTSILVSQILKSNYIGPIAVAAYSYMALVPVIQPFAIKLVTTKKDRMIRMKYEPAAVSKKTRIIFPIAVTFVVGLVAPSSVALVGFLMFGNLIRECGVLNTMSETAQNQLSNLITLLLGITISYSMQAERFVTVETLMIMLIGIFAFLIDTIAGVLLKIYELVYQGKSKSYGRSRRNFSVSYVFPCGAKTCYGGRPGQRIVDACCRGKCFRTDCFCSSRRTCDQSGNKIVVTAHSYKERIGEQYGKYYGGT